MRRLPKRLAFKLIMGPMAVVREVVTDGANQADIADVQLTKDMQITCQNALHATGILRGLAVVSASDHLSQPLRVNMFQHQSVQHRNRPCHGHNSTRARNEQ